MNIIKNDKNIKRCCFGMLAISLIVHQIGWKIARRKRWREWGGGGGAGSTPGTLLYFFPNINELY